MSELNSPAIFVIGGFVIFFVTYIIIDRLRFGRWIDRPSNREVKHE